MMRTTVTRPTVHRSGEIQDRTEADLDSEAEAINHPPGRRSATPLNEPAQLSPGPAPGPPTSPVALGLPRTTPPINGFAVAESGSEQNRGQTLPPLDSPRVVGSHDFEKIEIALSSLVVIPHLL